MIIEEVERPPFIHFGLMKQSIDVEVGQPFKIYQKNIYNDDYVFKINGVAADYENEYTVLTEGDTTFTARLESKLQTKEVDGNIITVTASLVKASSYKTLASSNTITASGGLI